MRLSPGRGVPDVRRPEPSAEQVLRRVRRSAGTEDPGRHSCRPPSGAWCRSCSRSGRLDELAEGVIPRRSASSSRATSMAPARRSSATAGSSRSSSAMRDGGVGTPTARGRRGTRRARGARAAGRRGVGTSLGVDLRPGLRPDRRDGRHDPAPPTGDRRLRPHQHRLAATVPPSPRCWSARRP